MNTKVCYRCGVEQSLQSYYTDNKSKDGHQNICVYCVSRRNTEKKYGIAVYYNSIPPPRERRVARIPNEEELAEKKEKRWQALVKRLKEPEYRALQMYKSRVFTALQRQNAGRVAPISELLGCSPKEFVRWLEIHFQEGMEWSNHGVNGWHIDHIRPIASFDLHDSLQQRVCFHFTNHQPLWAKDNLTKRDKYDGELFLL